MARWAVYLAGGQRQRPTRLGIVTAPDHRLALAKAIALFKIAPEQAEQLIIAELDDKH